LALPAPTAQTPIQKQPDDSTKLNLFLTVCSAAFCAIIGGDSEPQMPDGQ
jgi:hypothetical protein